MSWSNAGSVATYPTVTPARDTTNTSSVTLVFRADTSAGIVYVTGSFAVAAGKAVNATTPLLAAPLPATFRPKAAAALPTQPPSSTAATTSLQIAADGTVLCAGSAGQDYASTAYAVRAFYFTAVVPA